MMPKKTVINYMTNCWRRVKNHCRTTDNKDFTEKEPTETFKQKLLISEHTPIRLLEFDWSWRGIPYWLSTEWSRHKFEKFISSQRDDRLIDDTPRAEKPQGALVNFDGYANMQNLIDAWRKRMCYHATPEARRLAEDFKYILRKAAPLEASVLVPNCIYRMGCPEFQSCGFFTRFMNWAHERAGYGWETKIDERYKLYTTYLIETNWKPFWEEDLNSAAEAILRGDKHVGNAGQ